MGTALFEGSLSSGGSDMDELVWALFALRVALCDARGQERERLLERESELVDALADLLDPTAHVVLAPSPARAPSPSIF